MIDALHLCMANAFVLSHRAWLFHWNVIGPSFFELHKVFGDIYDRLSGEVDETAETIRARGDGGASGTSEAGYVIFGPATV